MNQFCGNCSASFQMIAPNYSECFGDCAGMRRHCPRLATSLFGAACACPRCGHADRTRRCPHWFTFGATRSVFSWKGLRTWTRNSGQNHAPHFIPCVPSERRTKARTCGRHYRIEPQWPATQDDQRESIGMQRLPTSISVVIVGAGQRPGGPPRSELRVELSKREQATAPHAHARAGRHHAARKRQSP